MPRCVHLLAADAGRDEALRTEPHHQDEHGAVEQEAILGELAEQLGQADEHDGADHDARDAAHAADDDDGHDVDRHEQRDAAREDGADERREDRPAQAREGGAEHVGERSWSGRG